MDIIIGDEQLFCLLPQMDMDNAREKAWDKKTAVFTSGISSLFSRPKAEEIRISYNEFRYEPFWHVVCQVHYEYDRKRNYIIPIISPEVQRITIHDNDYMVTAKPRQISIDGIEHCIEEADSDVIFDAIKSQQKDWKKYLSYKKETIDDLNSFAPEGCIVVLPEMRASAVVRTVLASMLRPIQADTIHSEKVDVKSVALYFRPVYAFEYKWDAKNKSAIAEFDGLTGEMMNGGKTLHQQVKGMITRDLIFDVGAMGASAILPGSGIAIRVAKAVVESRKQN